jgi:glyoxylase-like metal-dependent hydrolase (beta-lactamase superfamily II)
MTTLQENTMSLVLSVRAKGLIAAMATTAVLIGCSRHSEQATRSSESTSQPAPAAATPSSENVKRFAIGTLSAFALHDGNLDFANDGQTFALGHKPEEVAALLTSNGLPPDKLALSIQPLLVKAGERVLLFDTGTGGAFGPGSGKVQEAFAAAGIDPASVTDIFISHAHGDHVGGLVSGDGKSAFPNATIHLSAPELAYLKSLTPEQAAAVGIPKLTPLLAVVEAKADAFAPGSQIIPGLVNALDIKGHTPGHSGYLITSGESSLLYIGDAAHHSIVSVQKPDWAISFDGDAATAETSRAALLADVAAKNQRIYAVHFPFPGLGTIAHQGDGFVWVAE